MEKGTCNNGILLNSLLTLSMTKTLSVFKHKILHIIFCMCNIVIMLRTDLIKELARHQLIHPDSPFLRGGNAKSAGYVRRMEAEKKIQFAKISRPSKYMINKYGSTAPLFANDDVVDYSVARVPKPRAKTGAKNRGPTEAEEERAERARRAEQERRDAEAAEHAAEHAALKKSVLDCKKSMNKEMNTVEAVLADLKRTRGMRMAAKEEMEQKIVAKHRCNLAKIKQQYPQVYRYCKTHKLDANDLNAVYKHVRHN
jgi:hypothetical protein